LFVNAVVKRVSIVLGNIIAQGRGEENGKQYAESGKLSG
jgi:hypothetical protein